MLRMSIRSNISLRGGVRRKFGNVWGRWRRGLLYPIFPVEFKLIARCV